MVTAVTHGYGCNLWLRLRINIYNILLQLKIKMIVNGHKIKEMFDVGQFLEKIKGIKEEKYIITTHTLFRFKKEDREMYRSLIKEVLLHESPLCVGFQNNKNYAAFYKFKDKFYKIILDIQIREIYIVTFYHIKRDQIPEVRDVK